MWLRVKYCLTPSCAFVSGSASFNGSSSDVESVTCIKFALVSPSGPGAKLVPVVESEETR